MPYLKLARFSPIFLVCSLFLISCGPTVSEHNKILISVGEDMKPLFLEENKEFLTNYDCIQKEPTQLGAAKCYEPVIEGMKRRTPQFEPILVRLTEENGFTSGCQKAAENFKAVRAEVLAAMVLFYKSIKAQNQAKIFEGSEQLAESGTAYDRITQGFNEKCSYFPPGMGPQ